MFDDSIANAIGFLTVKSTISLTNFITCTNNEFIWIIVIKQLEVKGFGKVRGLCFHLIWLEQFGNEIACALSYDFILWIFIQCDRLFCVWYTSFN